MIDHSIPVPGVPEQKQCAYKKWAEDHKRRGTCGDHSDDRRIGSKGKRHYDDYGDESFKRGIMGIIYFRIIDEGE